MPDTVRQVNCCETCCRSHNLPVKSKKESLIWPVCLTIQGHRRPLETNLVPLEGALPSSAISPRLTNRCSRLSVETCIRNRGGSLPGPPTLLSGPKKAPDASTSQKTSATRDVAGSFVCSREYLLKPLEKVY